VRPIFWTNNSKSYISKTQKWDNFPNGRWGPSRSPAFLIHEEEVLSVSKKKSVDFTAKQEQWGKEINGIDDICSLFVKFIEKKVKKFPFSEGPLTPEADIIKDTLLMMNSNRLLTINSQPRCNGVKANDPIFGWGPERGFCYQKAYFEFFLPP